MSKPKTRQAIASFSYSAIGEMRRIPSKHWPDDCPSCNARMEFAFEPTRRVCSCGLVVTAEEVIRSAQ